MAKKHKISERELFGIPSRREMESISIADTFRDVRSGISMFGMFSYDLTAEDKAILKYLSENPDSTQTMMSEATGIKLQKVKSCTATLRTWGFLMRIGTSRQGSWKVLIDTQELK